MHYKISYHLNIMYEGNILNFFSNGAKPCEQLGLRTNSNRDAYELNFSGGKIFISYDFELDESSKAENLKTANSQFV